jgi:hypothetical protein
MVEESRIEVHWREAAVVRPNPLVCVDRGRVDARRGFCRGWWLGDIGRDPSDRRDRRL